MYLPAHFSETRSEELRGLISLHPLGTLVVNGPDGLDANHLPFEYIAQPGGQDSLIAHVARANLLWKEVSDGADALVIFRGEHAYVSPNWYPSTKLTARCPHGITASCMCTEKSESATMNASCAASWRDSRARMKAALATPGRGR